MKRLNKWRWLVLLALTAAVMLLYLWRAGWGFPLDDSWIHQAYGRNLGTRGEWSLIPGQPSAASTAPLYTVLLAVGYALRVPYLLWTHLLGGLALWLAGVFGARLADRIAPEVRYAGLAAGALIVLAWHLIWAASSGMETALFAMWTLLLPLLTWREWDDERNRSPHWVMLRGLIFGSVSALAMLTRPEGLGIAGLCGLAYIAVLARHRSMIRNALLWIGAAGLGFGVIVAPYLLLNLQLTGGLLPSTSAAKQAQHAPLLELRVPRRVLIMVEPLLAGGQILLLPGAIATVTVLGRRLRNNPAAAIAWVFVAWPVALVLLYAARLPAGYQHGRYVIPALPGFILIGTVGTLWLLKYRSTNTLARVLSRSLALSAGLSCLLMAVVVGPGVLARDVSIINEEMVASARWLDANIAPQDFLAVHDIGAVAYFTPRPILDIAGLVSPQVVNIVNDADALWALMQAQNAEYLMAFPDQIPGDDPTDPRLCEVFSTGGEAAIAAGGGNMAVYALAWDGNCDAVYIAVP